MKNKIQEKVLKECLIFAYLDRGFSKEESELKAKEYLSGKEKESGITERIVNKASSRTIELMEEEFRKLHQGLYNTNVMLTKKVKEQKADFRKMIEDVDIELMFTDIKDKDGDTFANSKEVMEVIEIWWNDKSKEILAKLGDDKVNKK